MSSYNEASAYIDRLSESLRSSNGSGGKSTPPGRGAHYFASSSAGSTSRLSPEALNISEHRYSSPNRNRLSATNASTFRSPTATASAAKPEFVRSSTSVLAAFRELQAKAKRLELSRADTIRECEDLKDSIAKVKRSKDLWQRQNETETMETMMSLKAQCDQMRKNRDEFQSKVKYLEEQQHQYQKTLASQKARSQSLEDDIAELHSKIRTEKFKKESVSRELNDIEHRCENLDDEVVRSPLKHKKQLSNKRENLEAIESQLDNVKRSTFNAEIKIQALRKYVDLLMNINGDLCTTLTAREMTKERILELARKYAPPRYSWPKHFEYVDMVKLLTDAAMTAAKDGAIARATAATIAAVGLSPFKGSSPLRASMQSNSSMGSGTRQRPQSAPVSRKVTAYHSIDPTAAAARLLLRSTDSIDKPKPKKRHSKKASGSLTRADGIESHLARTAAQIASLSIPTVNPDVEDIPSYRLAMSARNQANHSSFLDPFRADYEPVSPNAVRDIGPPIHSDKEGVFVPSGSLPSRKEVGYNEIAKKSQAHRSISQSVAAFHSAVKSLHCDG